MIAKKASPRAGRRRGHETNRTHSIVADRFPVCKLHDYRIVLALPMGCPFQASNPLDRILEVQQRGWAQLAKDELHSGLALLEIAETCDNCMDRLRKNSHARWLRIEGGCNA